MPKAYDAFGDLMKRYQTTDEDYIIAMLDWRI